MLKYYHFVFKHKALEFTGLVKIVVVEASDLEPTPRMTRLDSEMLQVSTTKLNPYVMVDIIETGSRGKAIARHIDRTVAMKGISLFTFPRTIINQI